MHLYRFYRPYWPEMAIGFLWTCAVAVCSVGLVALSAFFLTVSALIGGGSWRAAGFNALSSNAPIRFFAVSKPIARYIERLVTHKVTFGVIVDLRLWLFGKVANQSKENFRSIGNGDLMQSMVDDIDTAAASYMKVALPIATTSLLTILLVGVSLKLSMNIGICILLFVLVCGFVLPWIMMSVTRKSSIEKAGQTGHLRNLLVEYYNGFRELKLFDAIKLRRKIIHDTFLRLDGIDRHQHEYAIRLEVVRMALANATVLILMILGIRLLETEVISGPFLVMLILASSTILEMFSVLTKVVQQSASSDAAVKRITNLVSDKTSSGPMATNTSAPPSSGLTLQNVSFRYQHSPREIIKDLSWHFPKNMHTVITGQNGAGKTTLLQLIAGLTLPDKGMIYRCAGEEKASPVFAPNSTVSLMQQHITLFNATLLENLKLASQNATPAQITRALSKAHLHSLVELLSDGKNTLLGTNGVKISGGELRRVGMAQLFLRNSPFVLLDEPTAGLDDATEELILQSIEDLKTTSTVIVVSHRPSVIARFRVKLLLSDGKLHPLCD